VSVDATNLTSSGQSVKDRCQTLQVLSDENSVPESLKRPGHIQPIRTVEGGVRERPHHPEASVDLLKLSGLTPVGVLSVLMREDGELEDFVSLIEIGERMNFPVIGIFDLIEFVNERENALMIDRYHHTILSVTFEAETPIPTNHGRCRIRVYRDLKTQFEHSAVISGELLQRGALVRVHSECLTGESFGSLKCECRPQLDHALDMIDRDGGVVIYMRGHEGRGIGYSNKMRTYCLQENEGFDTLDANIQLGLPIDARDYTAASDILRDLGIESIRLLTNNPDKVKQLQSHGITVEEQMPIVVGVGDQNKSYLETKRDRMGHVIISSLQVHQQ
jgi:3,4-dihydroxy 2-butanone 4-phosphate synthase/GTP cyclohydrolase II